MHTPLLSHPSMKVSQLPIALIINHFSFLFPLLSLSLLFSLMFPLRFFDVFSLDRRDLLCDYLLRHLRRSEFHHHSDVLSVLLPLRVRVRLHEANEEHIVSPKIPSDPPQLHVYHSCDIQFSHGA